VGNFHETGGGWGHRSDGSLVVAPATPGPNCVPGPGKTCDYYPLPQDQDDWNTVKYPAGQWHVHPAGVANGEGWAQGPTDKDVEGAAAWPINIVVGAADKQVYFFGPSGVIGNMNLKDFLKK